MPFAVKCAVDGSSVHIDAADPNGIPLVMVTASSTVSNGRNTRTGPKISGCAAPRPGTPPSRTGGSHVVAANLDQCARAAATATAPWATAASTYPSTRCRAFSSTIAPNVVAESSGSACVRAFARRTTASKFVSAGAVHYQA